MKKAVDRSNQIALLIHTLLEYLGEDPGREGLEKTPKRVANMLVEITRGHAMSPDALLEGEAFQVQGDSMLVVKDIEFYSMCEHHLLPFFGKVHVGYIPDGKAVGLGRIPEVVDMYARRLQVQERLTEEVATLLERVLKPQGVGVVVEGFHLCLAMRGMQKQGARLVTSAMKGIFRKDARTRAEFLQLIGNRP